MKYQSWAIMRDSVTKENVFVGIVDDQYGFIFGVDEEPIKKGDYPDVVLDHSISALKQKVFGKHCDHAKIQSNSFVAREILRRKVFGVEIPPA